MNPSIKRLLGALLLIGTLGVTSVLAIRASAQTDAISHDPSSLQSNPALLVESLPAGDALNG